MKKNYHFSSVLAVVMLSFGLTATAQNANVKTSDMSSVNFKASYVKAKKPMTTAEGSVIKLPQKMSMSEWDGAEWKILREKTIKYNEKLLTVQEEEYYYDFYTSEITSAEYSSYVYNVDNEVIERTIRTKDTKESEWTNDLLVRYSYDKVCKDVAQACELYAWDEGGNEWYRSMDNRNTISNFYRQIERDAAGRVTIDQRWHSYEMALPDVGYYFTYADDNGHVTGLTVKVPDQLGELSDESAYENIVWHKTNDQLLKLTDDVYGIFNNDPENQPESFIYYRIYNGQKHKGGEIKNEYDEKDRLIAFNVFDRDGYGVNASNIINYDVTPDGGIDYIYYEWEDTNKNGTCEYQELNYETQSRRCVRFDEHHNVISDENYLYSYDTDEVDCCRVKFTWEHKYLEDGTLAESLETRYMNGMEMGRVKYVYSDFAEYDISGVDEVTGEASELIVYDGYVLARNLDGADYTITDLQGRLCNKGIVSDGKISLSNLADGLYIVSVNGKSVKVMNK